MKLICYYRVSTARQGRSGLGLEAQRATVEAYAKANKGGIVKAYQEVETGKRSDRPELLRAIAHAKRIGARLLVAKMDRLSRNAAFMCALCESGLDFVAADNPNVNTLTVKLLAVIAEQEAKDISSRTKAALAALRERGVKLGGSRAGAPRLTVKAQRKGAAAGAAVRRSQADQEYSDLYPLVLRLRSEGLTLRAIASRLDGEQYTTRNGKQWSATQVARTIERGERLRVAQ